MPLAKYRKKRDFERTPEPKGRPRTKARAPSARGKLRFVVQKHAATRLHYDFRLELEGVLKSWAVPKGPSLDPSEKRLAVEVEDHPIEYGGFEGIIPKGQYGGGAVLLWDRGTWTPQGDPVAGLRKGHLAFELHGKKLAGGFHLVRLRDSDGDKKNWLLMKQKDEHAVSKSRGDVVAKRPESVKSGRTIEEIEAALKARKRVPPLRRRPPDTPPRRPPPVRDPNPKPPVEDPPQKPRKKPMRDPVDQGIAAALTSRSRIRSATARARR